jgi:hypothetical protein
MTNVMLSLPMIVVIQELFFHHSLREKNKCIQESNFKQIAQQHLNAQNKKEVPHIITLFCILANAKMSFGFCIS